MKSQTLSPDAIEVAAEEVRLLTGLIFPPNRRTDFADALQHAMRLAGERDTATYLERVRREAAIHDELIAEITVGETYFFRDPAQLAAVRQLALATLPRDRRLRLWSAGCASGEEPYTLAMMVGEDDRQAATILGTDLSRTALTLAQRARYTRWSLRGVPEEAIQRHFEIADRYVRPVAAIREAVEFRYLNLAEDNYPSLTTGVWHMDIILCRNVLIYLDQATVARVATQLLESLSPQGWLFLGGADPMISTLVPCEVVTTSSGLAYRRRGAHQPVVAAAAAASTWLPQPVALDHDRLASWIAPAPDLPGSGGSTWLEQIRRFANGGEIERASRLCDVALEVERDSAELFYLHSVLLAEQGHHEAAAQAARRALYLDRDLAVAHIALGGSLSRSGDRRGALRAFRNAHALLTAVAPDTLVHASDGEYAGRLAAMTLMQLQLSEGAA